MPDVLILAYHFPPSNSSAAHRPDSWARYGRQYGFNPVVVTRHWAGLENDWLNVSDPCGTSVTVEESDSCEVIRLPYRDVTGGQGKAWKKRALTRKVYFLGKVLSGDFHTQANVMETFRPFLTGLLQKRKFHCILATAPPYQLIELAKELGQQFAIPFIADIRDLWNDNRALQVAAQWTAKEKFNEKLARHYIKRWVRPAALVTAVSGPLGEIATEGTSTPFAVVTNGYERTVYEAAEQREPAEFTLTLTGTIYPEQNFDVLLQGFRLFLDGKPRARFHFIGVSVFPQIEQKIKNLLPDAYIRIQPRIPKKEAIDLTVSSHVLFYVGWQGYRGFYSGKIFEYLAARRNILIAPGDRDVIDALLSESGAGLSVDTPEEVAQALQRWYNEWEQTGKLAYAGREEVIRKYSREEQTRKMAAEIVRIHSDHLQHSKQ